MRSFFRRARRSPARTTVAATPQGFWSLSRVIVAIAVGAWMLTIFILFRQREWVGNEQRAVVLIQANTDEVRQPLTLIVMRPDEKVYILPISPEQKIETPFNYGVYTSDALSGLTQLEDLRWEYLLYTLSLEFGVGLDGIIWTDRPVTTFGELRSVGLQALLNRKPSTLAWWDRMTLWRRLQQVPSYQVENEELVGYLNQDTKLLDTTRYDRWAELYLQDPGIRESGFSLAVQNGSGIEGYASRVGRMLGLMGYDLRSVETVGTNTLSELLWSKETASMTKNWAPRRLQQIMDPFRPRLDAGITEQARSQAVIRIGTDQVNLFRNRR